MHPNPRIGFLQISGGEIRSAENYITARERIGLFAQFPPSFGFGLDPLELQKDIKALLYLSFIGTSGHKTCCK